MVIVAQKRSAGPTTLCVEEEQLKLFQDWKECVGGQLGGITRKRNRIPVLFRWDIENRSAWTTTRIHTGLPAISRQPNSISVENTHFPENSYTTHLENAQHTNTWGPGKEPKQHRRNCWSHDVARSCNVPRGQQSSLLLVPDEEEAASLKKLHRVKRIINGWELEVGQWPWLVHLRVCTYSRFQQGSRIICVAQQSMVPYWKVFLNDDSCTSGLISASARGSARPEVGGTRRRTSTTAEAPSYLTDTSWLQRIASNRVESEYPRQMSLTSRNMQTCFKTPKNLPNKRSLTTKKLCKWTARLQLETNALGPGVRGRPPLLKSNISCKLSHFAAKDI